MLKATRKPSKSDGKTTVSKKSTASSSLTKSDSKTTVSKKFTGNQKTAPVKAIGITTKITDTRKTADTEGSSRISKDKLVKALITSDKYTEGPTTKVLKKVERRALPKNKSSKLNNKNEPAIENETSNTSNKKLKSMFNFDSGSLQSQLDPLNKLEAIKQSIIFSLTHPPAEEKKPPAAEILPPAKPLTGIEKLKLALKENMDRQRNSVLVEEESTTPKVEELSPMEKLAQIFASSIFGKASVQIENSIATAPLPTTTDAQKAEQVNAIVGDVDRLQNMPAIAQPELDSDPNFLSLAVNRLKSLFSVGTKEDTERAELLEQIKREDSEVFEYMQTLGTDISRFNQGNEDVKEGSGGSEVQQVDPNAVNPNSGDDNANQPDPADTQVKDLEVNGNEDGNVKELIGDSEVQQENPDDVNAGNPDEERVSAQVKDLEVGNDDDDDDDVETTVNPYQSDDERKLDEIDGNVDELDEENLDDDDYDEDDDVLDDDDGDGGGGGVYG